MRMGLHLGMCGKGGGGGGGGDVERGDITFVDWAWAQGIGDVTITLPAHNENDIAIAHVVSGGPDGAPTTPAGWTLIDNVTSGTADNNHVHGSWSWRRMGASESDPVFADAGDHQSTTVSLWRGCVTSGNPIEAFATRSDATFDTGIILPGVTTLTGKAMVVQFLSVGDDNTGVPGTLTNADLVSTSLAYTRQTALGHDGAQSAYYGVKTTAGAVGQTTGTLSTPEYEANLTLALTAAPA